MFIFCLSKGIKVQYLFYPAELYFYRKNETHFADSKKKKKKRKRNGKVEKHIL